MSAKRKKHKYVKKPAKWVIVLRCTVVFLAVVLLLLGISRIKAGEESGVLETESDTAENGISTTESTGDASANTALYLDDYLKITDIGPYTGIYMEDGTDELVSDVLMLIVNNFSSKDIQYAEITLPTANGDAHFSLSTVPAGESVVVLEKNRMIYTGTEDTAKAVSDNVVVFSEPLSLHEDRLKLQVMDGGINVTNISGENMDGEIIIYYKNAAADLLYGGITYRVRIEGGIKANEIKQIMATHFDDNGSRILFVTTQ